jgi:glycerol-3-phosphate acyltransferase PlsX
MKIGIDIMGGDYAPEEAIKGVISYLTSHADTGADVHFVLIGNPDLAAPYLSLLDQWQSHYTLVPSATVIGMHEHPTKALKEKQDSSIAIGFGLLQMGKIDAFFQRGKYRRYACWRYVHGESHSGCIASYDSFSYS